MSVKGISSERLRYLQKANQRGEVTSEKWKDAIGWMIAKIRKERQEEAERPKNAKRKYDGCDHASEEELAS